ncbi:MAG: ester cyclase [Vicinamibacterales bacterium]
MTRGEITSLVDRRSAAWAARDAAALAATHAQDGTVASPTAGVLEGREEIEGVYRTWFAAFPDLIVQQDALLIDGDRVAEIARLTGTHAGDFFGMAPTGRRIEVLVAIVMHVADGLVRHEQRIYDFTGLLIQVGVLKAKPTV